MKITKFVHSCLLVETDSLRALIDPGRFTYESHLINVNKLEHLDYIVFTHEHPDHYHEELLRKLSNRFKHAAIVTNDDLADKIHKLNLPNPVQTGSDDNLVLFEAKHQPLPLNLPGVVNFGVHLSDKLTHSGDSYEIKQTREILALPITAPFASLKEALDAVIKLKPKMVLPMHDWEWHKQARESRYALAKELLRPHGIEFVELENAQPVEI
jgi:L-ascorbate metabolism protein UlaG (beta-lactamase superfamily)